MQELRMYYDGNTGRYLEYDEDTNTYKYHAAVGSQANNYSNNAKSRHEKKKYKKKKDRSKVKIT